MAKRNIITALILAAAALTGTHTAAQFNAGRLLSGLQKAVSSITLSDSQVVGYVHEFIEHNDSVSEKLPPSDPYSKRLARITQGLTEIDGVPLNFAVYKTDQVNAFACADGSVRVYTGLMDLMNDNEVLGVIGHEIGHVAHHDSKNAFKKALMDQAIMDGIASTSNTMAALTDSQLAKLGESLSQAKHSRKQEQNADDYGYSFLVAHGKNPIAMANAFQKLQQIEQAGGAQSNAISELFSDHPDVGKRIDRVVKRAKKDGYINSAGQPVALSNDNTITTATKQQTSVTNSKNSKSKSTKKASATKTKSIAPPKNAKTSKDWTF